ncbi:MAG: dicarboxylate/amino acid:cation symporter [Gemmatimonadetes bacterium]|nr:dicarboxylate/amino acid:cation symporter [Gemmatimonadota bacterium]
MPPMPPMTRRGSDGVAVLVALVVGLALGALIAASGNARLAQLATAIQPIGTLWVNAIRMTVIPLVVSLLITGVASVADLRTVGRLGGRTLVVFASLLAMGALVPAVTMPFVTALFPWPDGGIPLPPGAAEAAQQVRSSGTPVGVVEWFTTLIPPNPVEAAASGNMVSLIVFVFLLALATARSAPESREPLVRFFKALGEVMLLLVGWIITLAPIAVFALVLPLAVQGGGALVGAVGYYIASFAIGSAIVVALLYPIVASLGGIGIGRFARAVLPTQMIAISCSSSIASLPAMVSSADAMGIPARVSGFVLPLAVSVFKPAAGVAWVVGVLFVSRVYGIEIGARELGIVAAAAVLLSFAAPGVPRGAFLLLTPLLTAIGLPAEGVGVLIAVDLIPDMFATVINVTGDVTATALVARLSRDDVVPAAPPVPAAGAA